VLAVDLNGDGRMDIVTSTRSDPVPGRSIQPLQPGPVWQSKQHCRKSSIRQYHDRSEHSAAAADGREAHVLKHFCYYCELEMLARCGHSSRNGRVQNSFLAYFDSKNALNPKANLLWPTRRGGWCFLPAVPFFPQEAVSPGESGLPAKPREPGGSMSLPCLSRLKEFPVRSRRGHSHGEKPDLTAGEGSHPNAVSWYEVCNLT
jgi:hypothetical protein